MTSCRRPLRHCALAVWVWGAASGASLADTPPDQLVGEIYSMIMGLLHDVRFLRDPQAVARTEASWARLVKSYTNGSPP